MMNTPLIYVRKLLNALIEEGKIEAMGANRNRVYKLKGDKRG